MTAQTNDPLSAFAYPQTNNTPTSNFPPQVPQATTPPAPASTTVTPVPTDTPLTQPVQSTNGSDIRGMVIEGPAPVPGDPSLLVPDPSQNDANVENVVVPTPTDQPPLDMPVPMEVVKEGATTVEEPVKKEEPEEEHLSPLQVLAKKLAKLREELVEEVPEKNEEVKLDQPVVKQEEAPVEPVKEVSEAMPSAPSLSTNDITPPVQDLQPTENMTVTEQANVESTVVEPTLQTTQDQTPQESTSLAQPLSSPVEPVPATNPVDQLQNSEVVSQTDLLTPVSPVAPTSKLEQMFPEVVEKPNAQNDLTQKPVESSSVVLDENNNDVVDASSVELASANSKYPMSINKIMDIAIERNASDIQISVGYPVMIRIDGSLIAVNEHIVSPANSEELIMPVLSDQKKELLEVNREVDLAYSPLHNADARFRINAYYSKGNLTAAFRLIPSKIRTIEELMLPPIYNQIIRMGQGLVLVTGPTGHGKSTTLAAMLQAINLSRSVHMITIEDPIEYMFKPEKAVIDQREMHDDTHSWTVALKSALRQDPDVILVGEMRDYETIASTITLAETGHLVFATLHTNSAAQTVDRIIDVFPENQQAQIRTQLANILEVVIAQRLIPIDGGGRRAVSEIMLGNPAVRNLIREGKTHQIDNVIRTSSDIGMVSLEQSLVKLVREGLITMEKAQEYAVHPEEVVRLLKS